MTRPKSPQKKQSLRGGKRPGAGRPVRETVPITVRLHPSTVAALTSGGRAHGRSERLEAIIVSSFARHLQDADTQDPQYWDEENWKMAACLVAHGYWRRLPKRK